MADILDLERIFANAFSWRKFVKWHVVNISSGNGLVLNRQQAIAWTNDDPVQWYIYIYYQGLIELRLENNVA